MYIFTLEEKPFITKDLVDYMSMLINRNTMKTGLRTIILCTVFLLGSLKFSYSYDSRQVIKTHPFFADKAFIFNHPNMMCVLESPVYNIYFNKAAFTQACDHANGVIFIGYIAPDSMVFVGLDILYIAGITENSRQPDYIPVILKNDAQILENTPFTLVSYKKDTTEYRGVNLLIGEENRIKIFNIYYSSTHQMDPDTFSIDSSGEYTLQNCTGDQSIKDFAIQYNREDRESDTARLGVFGTGGLLRELEIRDNIVINEKNGDLGTKESITFCNDQYVGTASGNVYSKDGDVLLKDVNAPIQHISGDGTVLTQQGYIHVKDTSGIYTTLGTGLEPVSKYAHNCINDTGGRHVITVDTIFNSHATLFHDYPSTIDSTTPDSVIKYKNSNCLLYTGDNIDSVIITVFDHEDNERIPSLIIRNKDNIDSLNFSGIHKYNYELTYNNDIKIYTRTHKFYIRKNEVTINTILNEVVYVNPVYPWDKWYDIDDSSSIIEWNYKDTAFIIVGKDTLKIQNETQTPVLPVKNISDISDVRVWRFNNRIVLDNCESYENISVFSLDGSLIAEHSVNNRKKIALRQNFSNNVYILILKNGNITKKIKLVHCRR